jgi:transposase
MDLKWSGREDSNLRPHGPELHTVVERRRRRLHCDPCFASKVIRHVRLGFAAGCEAVAVPRRHGQIYLGAMPSFGLRPRVYWAKGRTRGIAQR